MKTKINQSNLSHLNVQCRLAAAMRKTAKLGHSVSHIANRKGEAFLACRYIKGDVARRVLGKSSGFWWTDNKGNNISGVVAKSLLNVA